MVPDGTISQGSPVPPRDMVLSHAGMVSHRGTVCYAARAAVRCGALFAIIPKMHTSSSSETELKCSARCLTDMSTSAPPVTTRQ